MPAYQATVALELLRREQHPKITQQQMARHFELADRETVRKWEIGEVIPSEDKYRSKFVSYLLDKLRLTGDHEKFFSLWNSVMVEQWQWAPLAKSDLPLYLSIAQKLTSSLSTSTLVPSPPHQKLIGRKDLLDKIKSRLTKNFYFAFWGKPGVGKSDLALRLIHDANVLSYFSDGILWAGLGYKEGENREDQVLEELGKWAKALGISVPEISRLTSIQRRIEAIRTVIGKRKMLFVIDDVWKLEDAQSFVVGGPNCTYVITTRIPGIAFEFAGENAIETLELDTASGLELLYHQAQFLNQDVLPTAQEIVELVDGLPLALILLGNHLREKSYSRQQERIQQTLEQMKDADTRFQYEHSQSPANPHPSLPLGTPISLSTVIAISDQSLDNAARQALRSLSLFPSKPNTFSDEAAVAVSGESPNTIDALCSSGLLEVKEQGRYTLHQTIADYAHLNFTDSGEQARIITFFVNFAVKNQENLDKLDLEFRNIKAALERAWILDKQSLFVEGTKALARYFDVRGLYSMGIEILTRAQQVANALGDNKSFSAILLGLGRIELWRGNFAQAKEAFHQCLQLISDEDNRPLALSLLGLVAFYQGEFSNAKQYYEQGISIARQLGVEFSLCGLLTNLGFLKNAIGDYDGARIHQEEALGLARKLNRRESIGEILQNMGATEHSCGNYQLAKQYHQEGIAIARELGNRLNVLTGILNLGNLALQEGNEKQAEQYDLEALEMARAMNQREKTNILLANLGELKSKQSHYKQAEIYLEEALSIAHALNHPWLLSGVLSIQGEHCLRQSDLELGLTAFTESLKIAQAIKAQDYIAAAMFGLARIMAKQDKLEDARRQGEQSLSIFQSIGHFQAKEVEQFLTSLAS